MILIYSWSSLFSKVSICSECKDSRKHKSHKVDLVAEVLEDEKNEVDGIIKKGVDASTYIKDFLVVAEQVKLKKIIILTT